MKLQINGMDFQIDPQTFHSLAIPVQFDGAQPNAFGVERASSQACEAGSLIGDTRRGGSCNFEQIRLIPHCNGTHTECVGHITTARISIQECLRDVFSIAQLVSVTPEKASETADTYVVKLNEDDLMITKKAIETAIANRKSQIANRKSVIVRTLPNLKEKLAQTYLEKIPPFFSTEAMEFLVESGIEHLLVDLPSIDRLFDEGKLSNHRIFWKVEQGAFETNAESRLKSTVTELIFVADEIADGFYLLNLQIAPFQADASPSRPLIWDL